MTNEQEVLLERAKSILKLPENKFIGTNNIRNILLGYATIEDVMPHCFSSVDVNLTIPHGLMFK